jgi:ABC-type uncharacterized transport system auxiliary subunit
MSETVRRVAAGWPGGVGLLFLLLTGCASAPELRYYRVAVPTAAPAVAPLPVTLGVARLAAAEPCRQERILYRNSPYRVQYYAADRWEVPPAEMVQEALLTQLRASGRFRRVVAWRPGEADARLEVRLLRFEEVDEAQEWAGEVELEYEVVTGAERSLWRGVSRQRVSAEARSVEAVVAALSRALAASLIEVTERTAAELQAR